MNDLVTFRMQVDGLIFKYSREDQDNILADIKGVCELMRVNSINIDVVGVIIFYYFKNKKD